MTRKNLRKISYKAVDIMGGVMFAIMVIFTGINVFTMWFIGKRYSQLEEIVLAAYVWVAYLSLGHHYRDNQCVSVDFLVQRLPEKGQKIVEVIKDICSFIIGLVILILAWKLMMKSVNKYTAVLKIQYCWIDLGVVVGFISLVVNILGKYIPGGKDKDELLTSSEEGGDIT